MKISKGYPPNIQELRLFFPVNEDSIFCYGDTIYAQKEVPPDIFYHEKIHSEQQGDNPKAWWHEYLINKKFRQEQEVEAYACQLNFIKQFYPNRAMKEALSEMAENLSSKLYKLNLTKSKAETLIRLKLKKVELVGK